MVGGFSWIMVPSSVEVVVMIEVNFSSLKDTKVSEYAARFLSGGVCTVLAGLVAQRYGAGIGGLFLAFPAIFPAGASLIESHEKRRKARIGSDGRNRGRLAASIDSAGTSLGCIGLLGFALVLWKGLLHHNAFLIIGLATIVWGVLAWISLDAPPSPASQDLDGVTSNTAQAEPLRGTRLSVDR